jgi:hypothetical protein
MMKYALSILMLFALACASTPQVADRSIDWGATDAYWSLHVVTIDPDGSERVTRIWLAVLDAMGGIRTGNSRWWQNLERDRHCLIRLDGVDYPVDVEFAGDFDDKVRIDEAFTVKYGWMEGLMFPQDRGETHKNYAFLVGAARP